MTKAEAIDRLKDIVSYYTNDRDFSYYGDQYQGLNRDERDAIDMAIKALKTSENPIMCPRCGRWFSELEGREHE